MWRLKASHARQVVAHKLNFVNFLSGEIFVYIGMDSLNLARAIVRRYARGNEGWVALNSFQLFVAFENNLGTASFEGNFIPSLPFFRIGKSIVNAKFEGVVLI